MLSARPGRYSEIDTTSLTISLVQRRTERQRQLPAIDAGDARVGEARHQRLEPAFVLGDAVSRYASDMVAGGPADAHVERPTRAVFRDRHDLLDRIAADHLHGVVAALVVDDDDLEVRIVLLEQHAQAMADPRLLVPGADDDGDLWSIGHRTDSSFSRGREAARGRFRRTAAASPRRH